MKYKADIVYKGLSCTVALAGTQSAEKPSVVQVPGDVEVHVEGEYSWLEMVTFGWLLKILSK